MGLFERASENKEISKSVLKNWLVSIFREGRSLILILKDKEKTVNKLHHVVKILFGIMIATISLNILEIFTTKELILGSQYFLTAIIFGGTLKTILESIILLFVRHPFDVGDRCEIDEVEMVVEEMNFFTTVFLLDSGQKIITLNCVLWTKSISNYNRSLNIEDTVEFYIDIATPMEKISAMEQRITSYIENQKNHWCPEPMIIMKGIELKGLRMEVCLTHTINHQYRDEGRKRRSLLVEEMVNIFRELDIQFLLPIDINVSTMPRVVGGRLKNSWSNSVIGTCSCYARVGMCVEK